MTKQVRIQHADESAYSIVVESWQWDSLGGPPRLIASVTLSDPKASLTEYVYGNEPSGGRFIVVKELK